MRLMYRRTNRVKIAVAIFSQIKLSSLQKENLTVKGLLSSVKGFSLPHNVGVS